MRVRVSPSLRKSKAASLEVPEVKIQPREVPPPGLASRAEPAAGLRASMALRAA